MLTIITRRLEKQDDITGVVREGLTEKELLSNLDRQKGKKRELQVS